MRGSMEREETQARKEKIKGWREGQGMREREGREIQYFNLS